jgi:exopolysaccharide biosynthesis WecB/TagA/CpsF family protein
VFLLGAKPGVAARAARRLAALCPQHRIVGTCHGYFSRDQADAVTDEVRRSRADVLLVAMGNLDQELWLTDHLSRTGCFLGLGVGALFDFLAGAVPRAPAWVRAVHLEWLYRLLREPSRMWRRYLVGMPVFLLRVTVQWLGGGRVTRAARR